MSVDAKAYVLELVKLTGLVTVAFLALRILFLRI